MQIYDNDDPYNYYFGGWDDPRALFFVQNVIGYQGIQGLMPVNYVQAYQDGLSNTEQKLRNSEPQGRSTLFDIYRAETPIPFDLYPRLPRMSPGSNFMIYGLGGGGPDGVSLWRQRAQSFQSFMSIKNYKLTELYLPQEREITPKLTQKGRFAQ